MQWSVPVRVRSCEIPKLLQTRVYIDLVNLDERGACSKLLDGVREDGHPRGRQPFPPNLAKPRFPGALPGIWHVPQARNPNFTGRDQLLKAVGPGGDRYAKVHSRSSRDPEVVLAQYIVPKTPRAEQT